MPSFREVAGEQLARPEVFLGRGIYCTVYYVTDWMLQ
jgi:hypothetical protein